ncbi:MAG: class I SAM-dependent methyltransferase [Desulfobacteraceae bacterium]|nr:class I SAM-dependent methyltransferase [Desulfobacteraceae bacterium]
MRHYGKICTLMYDLDKTVVPEEDLTFYLNYVEEANGPVLQPMVGTGRFALPLMEKGFKVDGVDASADMLAKYRRVCKERGYDANIYENTLAEMELPELYALIFITSGSFSLIIDDEEISRSLVNVNRHLLPGGRFVFEVSEYYDAHNFDHHWNSKWLKAPEGEIVLQSVIQKDQDRSSDIVHSLVRYELIKDGKLVDTEFLEFSLKCHNNGGDTLKALLKEHGFEDIIYYNSYDKTYDKDRKGFNLIVECRKKQ